ncbi:MAG: AcrR family transcriptional regulator [Sneathiella sp.]|jgi:AcrR family transcriptional regulator
MYVEIDQTIDLIMQATKKQPAAARLIEMAGPLFADRPFDAVSTRELARAASVNLSAISYHFGSKEGLYDAVCSNLINDLAPVRNGFKNFLDAGLAAAKDNPDLQRQILKTFVCLLIDAITSNLNPRWKMRLMLREIQSVGPCFEKVMSGHIDIMHDLAGRLVSVIKKEPEDSVSVKLVSHSLISLCLQYSLNEPLLSHRLGWEGFKEPEIAILKRETVDMVFRMLGLPPMTAQEGL